MLRATILTIVLMFAAGPSVSLLCQAWCEPQAAAPGGCHHDDATTPGVGNDRTCDHSTLLRASVEKEHLRRAPVRDSAVVPAAWFRTGAASANAAPAWRRGLAPPDVNRPQTSPLRL